MEKRTNIKSKEGEYNLDHFYQLIEKLKLTKEAIEGSEDKTSTNYRDLVYDFADALSTVIRKLQQLKFVLQDRAGLENSLSTENDSHSKALLGSLKTLDEVIPRIPEYEKLFNEYQTYLDSLLEKLPIKST